MMFDKENVWYDSKTRDRPVLLGNLLGKELLVCPLCHEYYKDPRILPCAHTFCRSCLQSYYERKQNDLHTSQRLKTMPCPTCQMEIVVPTSGVSGYKLDDKVRQKKEEFISALRHDTANPTAHESSSDPGVSTSSSFGRSSHRSPRLSDLYNEARGHKNEETNAADTKATSSPYRLSQDKYRRPEGDYAQPEYHSRTKPRNNVQRSSSLRDKQHRARTNINFRDDHGFTRSGSRTRENSRERSQPNVEEEPVGPDGFSYTPPSFENTRAARFASRRLRRAPSPAGGFRNSYVDTQDTPGQPKMSSWSSNESINSSHSYGPTSTASEPNGFQKTETQEERFSHLLERYGRRSSDVNGQSGNSKSSGDQAFSPRSDRTSSFSASPFTSPSTPSADNISPPNGVSGESPGSPIPPSRRSSSMRRRKKGSETEVPPSRDIPHQDSLERKTPPPNLKEKLAESRSRSNSRTDSGAQDRFEGDTPKKDKVGYRNKSDDPAPSKSPERPSRKTDRIKRPTDLKNLNTTQKPSEKSSTSPKSPKNFTAWEALSGSRPLTRQGSYRDKAQVSPSRSYVSAKGKSASPEISRSDASNKDPKLSSHSDTASRGATQSVPKSPNKSPKESSFPWKTTPKTEEQKADSYSKSDPSQKYTQQQKAGRESCFSKGIDTVTPKESVTHLPTKNSKQSLPTSDKSEAINSTSYDCVHETQIPSKPERIIQGSSGLSRNETNNETNVIEKPAPNAGPNEPISLEKTIIDNTKVGETKDKTRATSDERSNNTPHTVTHESVHAKENAFESSKLHDTVGARIIDKADKCITGHKADENIDTAVKTTPVVNDAHGATLKQQFPRQQASVAEKNGSGDHNRTPDSLKGISTTTALNANKGKPHDPLPAKSACTNAASNCDSNVTLTGQVSKAAIHDDDDIMLNSSSLQQDIQNDNSPNDIRDNTEESTTIPVSSTQEKVNGVILVTTSAQSDGMDDDDVALGSLYRTREVWKLERSEYEMPTSVIVTGNGTSVLADYSSGNLQYFDSSGQLTHIVKGIKPFCLATNVANHVIVADRRLRTVRVFDEHGADVNQWEEDMFKWIAGLAATSRGQFVVYDREFCRVGIYSGGGERLSEFGAYGTRDTQLCMADFVTVDNNDRIIMCDSGNHCIKVFDTNGDCLLKFGTRGQRDGQLEWPKGVCVDSHNNIIVADYCNRRVSMFSPDGNFIQHLLKNWPNPYSVCFREPNMLGVTHYSLSGYSKVGLYVLDSNEESPSELNHNGMNENNSC